MRLGLGAGCAGFQVILCPLPVCGVRRYERDGDVDGLAAPAVLSAFDAQTQPVPVPPKAPVTCKDADDQKFIDLAVHHRATLLSKDAAVLCMKKRLQALAVWTSTAILLIA